MIVKNFWDVFVLAAGGIHGAPHPCAPPFHGGFMNIKSYNNHMFNLRGENIRLYIVGDVAYHFLINIQNKRYDECFSRDVQRHTF